MALAWQADLRHEGQASELTIHYDGDDADELEARFIAEYAKTYGYRDDSGIELVTLRVIGRGRRRQRLDFKELVIREQPVVASGWRRVSLARGAAASTVAVVTRRALSARPRRGPLIIEEFDATVAIPADAEVSLDAIGNIVLELS
jgi:N-methylhydantoinase A